MRPLFVFFLSFLCHVPTALSLLSGFAFSGPMRFPFLGPIRYLPLAVSQQDDLFSDDPRSTFDLEAFWFLCPAFHLEGFSAYFLLGFSPPAGANCTLSYCVFVGSGGAQTFSFFPPIFPITSKNAARSTPLFFAATLLTLNGSSDCFPPCRTLFVRARS